jgi:Spy/CpxP family protein refolding chaperone
MKSWLLAAAAVLSLAGPAQAQEKKDDRFAKALFDPQLVLQHAKDIGMTAPQRSAILDAVKRAQTDLVPLQLEMAEPALELTEIIEETKVDEASALAKADKMLKIENEVKKAQMSLLIKIKNILTKEQQDRLRTIRGDGKSGGDDAAANEER